MNPVEKREDSPAFRTRRNGLIAVATFLALAWLLFAKLGHYALWDDEAMTALNAKAVLRTGDTSMMMDHGNIVAYRNALHIRDGADRMTPPLASYVTAASFALFGIDAWSARLPAALFGLATIALILLWARNEELPFMPVLALGLLGNVSLILFFRQCRYYAPTIFFSVALAFLYWRGKPSPRNLLIFAILSVLLFASNYMGYAGIYTCLAVDYLFWRRKEKPFHWREALLLFGPQLILIGAISSVWNPLRTPLGAYEGMNSLIDRLTLFAWCWRDLDRCEFFALPLLIAAFVVGMMQKRMWMVRGCAALVVYVAIVSFTSPQIISHSVEAEVRYLAPIIPLAIALEAGTLCALVPNRRGLLYGLAIIVFGTNLLNGGSFLSWGFRSTLLSYMGEISLPQKEPYTPTAQWIDEHVPEGKSIWVAPYYATYPLMFEAPKALYAWQLSWPPRPDLAGLPKIHFAGQEPPDYLIAFGPSLGELGSGVEAFHRAGINYRHVETIPVFWKDMYRPELCWRVFESKTDFKLQSEAVYIYQRAEPPTNPAAPAK